MKVELQEQLFDAYPTIFQDRAKSPRESLMCFGIECGDGWFRLIYDLCEKLSQVSPGAVATQVKEKYGTLRFYARGCTDEGWNAINEAEERSASICEGCGEPGKLRGTGWVITLCGKCWDDKKQGDAVL